MFVQAINIPIGLDIRVSNLGVGVEHTYVQAYNTALVGVPQITLECSRAKNKVGLSMLEWS